MNSMRKIGIYAGIILLFLGLAYSFVPEVLDGKIVNQHDISGWKGMAHEAMTHNETNPEDQTAWTNSMFGGMPTTAIVDNFEGDWTKSIYDTLMYGKRPATYLFIALLGGFLLMMSLGVRKLIAVGGAIAMAFCSYNMQIIQVGHNTKMQAIAFMPWVLAGVIYTYRAALGGKSFSHIGDFDKETSWKTWLPKTLLGSVLFALALSMQIKANHIQITYYLAIVIFALALGILIYIIAKKKEMLKRFFAASGLLLVLGVIGIATNANKLIPTYEYTPYTMRGGSELTSDSETHNDKGLDLEYATRWSYGIEEMPNLMIPNYNGGSSSGALDRNSATGKFLEEELSKQLREFGYRGAELEKALNEYGKEYIEEPLERMPLYWGPQPFTAGPMYMGAITVFLFVLGAILCKGREKWWLIIASIVTVFLAWGNHFMWFTELWFEYVPFYNKFRTVSMALVVLQITLPMLGFYALDRILRNEYSTKKLTVSAIIAFAVTGLFCLIHSIAPGLAGDFTAEFDSQWDANLGNALALDRMRLLQSDALKSFVMIALAFALIYWAHKWLKRAKNAKEWNMVHIIAAAVMAVLVLFDLWSVGKRYLNESHFVTEEDFAMVYKPRVVDKVLKKDKDPNFRVFDLSEDTFNSSRTSYFHKSIGGYSPVKLQRYQDFIDSLLVREHYIASHYLSKDSSPEDIYEVTYYMQGTSLLNGKYIIAKDGKLIQNPHAFGNCWFVEDYVKAETPDEELGLLNDVDLRRVAVIGKDFENARKFFDSVNGEAKDASAISDRVENAEDYINLKHYAPNELRYSFKTSAPRAAVFSEIYYPKGWKAWIEPAGKYGEVVNGHYIPSAQGKQLDLFRADWILRGAIVPEGEGVIVMRFEPESYQLGENISLATSICLIILLLLSCCGIVIPQLHVKH